MYSLALQNNYTAATFIDDTPVVFNILGSRPYRPINYDGKFHGRLTLRYALANSFNVPAVKVLNTLGVDNFINHAKKLGIETWTDPSRFGLSLTLGGGEVTMTDMAEAFGVFANLGRRKDVSPILKITNTVNNTVLESDLRSKRVLDPGISYIISDILSDNNARTIAFGRNSSLEIPGYKVAVKTGTTDEKKDNWTIGYTPEFLVVVWVGNNDNTPMNPYLTSGITGAAPIWNKVMTQLLKKYSTRNTWLEQPNDVIEKNCFGGRKEYFLKGTENLINCAIPPIVTVTPTPQQ
jgi:membrane peptidoglycan carboxypeptidase